jgi:hypothetical protein
MLNGDGGHRVARMTRDEALQHSRTMLERHPVDPGLMADLRQIIPDEEVLTMWLVSANGWLRSDTPLEHVGKREAVLDAARKALTMDHFWGSSNQWRAYQQQAGE